MNEIDKDEDDYINLEEFKAAVGWDESAEDVGVANTFTAPPPPQSTGKDRIGNSFTVLSNLKALSLFIHKAIVHIMFRYAVSYLTATVLLAASHLSVAAEDPVVVAVVNSTVQRRRRRLGLKDVNESNV